MEIFGIEKSVTINELEDRIKKEDYSNFIKIEDLFPNEISISINKKDLGKYLNGVLLDVDVKEDKICKVYNENKFIGIGKIKNKKLKRDIVLSNCFFIK